ncbi:MAG: hypothetical protein O2856_01815 [Planctomycetota bacterium]|nr:hypothetical protein [Planctomycetota bacterium]
MAGTPNKRATGDGILPEALSVATQPPDSRNPWAYIVSVPVNVVVTCTKRKSVAVPQRLQFRSLRRADVQTKAELWLERLRAARTDSVVVRDLYSGDHWSVARSLEGLLMSGSSPVRLWVVSAGYGLLQMDDVVKPYSATFSRNHPDSISLRITSDEPESILRNWWNALADDRSVRRSGPQTLAGIAAEFPNSPLIVIASENYLSAIDQDLMQARGELSNSDLLSIFSAGCSSANGLAPHLVPCDARLQPLVGGALRSLNIRTARKALSESTRSLPTLPVLRRKFRRLLSQQPELVRIERTVMSDDDVRQFLLSELSADNTLRHTPLLRKLRDQGFACEQRRFATLFYEVKGALHGS